MDGRGGIRPAAVSFLAVGRPERASRFCYFLEGDKTSRATFMREPRLDWLSWQVPTEMPYWMRSIGRHLRARCLAEPKLPFEVRLNLLKLVRVEGEMHVLHVYSGLF